MSNKTRFYFHHEGDTVIPLEIKRSFEAAPAEGPNKCPCCEADLKPLADICQFGLFDDDWRTYLVCHTCSLVIEYHYQIANYDLVSKREQKKSGLLISKKILAKPGSGA